MQLLKFFLEWGEKGLGFLWVLYIAVSAILLIQAYRGSKSGWTQVNDFTGTKSGKENLSFWKANKTILWYCLTFGAIIIHFGIQNEWFD